jgi:hypothetical protein
VRVLARLSTASGSADRTGFRTNDAASLKPSSFLIFSSFLSKF